MTMIDIAPHWGLDKTRAPATFTQRWISAVTNRPDDDYLVALGIRIPKPRPTLPQTAAVKVETAEDAPCLVASASLQVDDRIALKRGEIRRVYRVIGRTVHCAGGLTFDVEYMPTVMLVERSTGQPPQDTRKKSPLDMFAKQMASEPKCPPGSLGTGWGTPPETPTIDSEKSVSPEPVTLEQASEKMVGGRPPRKLVEKVLPANITLFLPGDDVPINQPEAPKANRFKVTSYDDMKAQFGDQVADRWAAMNEELLGVLRK